MDNITNKVREEMERGWIGSNTECPYHPCHFTGQDCTFCFCPFYPCNDTDLGESITSAKGKEVWACTYCLFMHRPEVGRFVMSRIEDAGIADPKDPRIADVFAEAKGRFCRNGKALMVLGATSDAGKSITVAALCRLLHRRGYLVAPFKSQNMSLNSKVTPDGSEIAMIQTVQSRAAGLCNPDRHMNPILLKPKGDMTSQVIVEGKPYGDYDVEGYYGTFVQGPGREIVRRNVDFLKMRYDFVVMEGAGSPAEINIYDRDIANIGAARIAGADCLLVINMEWGGSFAYALGTLMLIPEEDRGMIKGVILNNVRGDMDRMEPVRSEMERVLGLPVIGMIPHIDITLPSEDSESFRGMFSKGHGDMVVSMVKFPRIANFTDLDPLCLENVTMRFVEDPAGLEGSDAIILPGTKNTMDDLEWMESTGISDALAGYRGKVPILGICGGYQMMGTTLSDVCGIEGTGPRTAKGLGFFNNTTEWNEYRKTAIRDSGRIAETGGLVTGYEIHMGQSTVGEEPLFSLDRRNGAEGEGSFRRDELLFGTYLHGVFDKPSFREFFLSFADTGDREPVFSGKDYDDVIEDSIERLASAFEENMDMKAFLRFAGVSE